MADKISAWVYIVGLLFAEYLRWRYRWARTSLSSKNPAMQVNLVWPERLVLAAILTGIWLLPLLYLATPWLDRLDYRLPFGLSLLGIGIFILGLYLRYRSQSDLARNWSPSLVIWEGHQLVTEGIYSWIRHPLYSSLILWGMAQPLLLHNWAAGWGGILAAGLVFILRVPREEAMLEAYFGEAYSKYWRHTGAIFPRRKPHG